MISLPGRQAGAGCRCTEGADAAVPEPHVEQGYYDIVGRQAASTWTTRYTRAAHDIAREGDLPLRWEGSYHIWAPDQIEAAAESLLRLRARYSHGKLQFNTVKIHYDGMPQILTAGMLEPYATDPDNHGGVLVFGYRVISQ